MAGDVYRGHEGIRRWYADANDPWDRLLPEPEEIIEHGGLVVILVHATRLTVTKAASTWTRTSSTSPASRAAAWPASRATPPSATRAARSAGAGPSSLLAGDPS
jgi:hypothetical protein